MITDSLGQCFKPMVNVQRIVSLVPSTTETLCALGLESKVVGITRYCVHPPHLLSTKSTIGGTKQVNWKSLEHINPEIAIGNKEENTPAIFDGLKKRNIPYFVAFPQTLEEAKLDIYKLGELFGVHQTANEICQSITSQLSQLKPLKNTFTYAYLIWRKPWMAVNHNTFIDSMLSQIGGINICSELAARYPTLSLEKLMSLNPDVIFLSSEPYAFNDTHVDELKMAGFRQPVIHISGEYCSWHGVRIKEALNYLQALKSTQIMSTQS